MEKISITQVSKTMLPIVLLTVFVSWASAVAAKNDTSSNSTMYKSCATLNRLMLEQNQACRCFDSPSFAMNSDPYSGNSENDESDISSVSSTDDQSSTSSSWIGCSRDNMPAVYKALTALPNETNLTQLWIWDAFIPSIPSKFFVKVRPSKLIVERCHTGFLNSMGLFVPLADRLTELELKNNVLQDINAELLAPLRRLIRLDLSINELSQIKNTTLGKSLTSLRSLSFYRNQISQIADGALDHLQQLRSLNLANNRLTRITAATFRNLRHLEYLNLENNQIEEIAENAFLHLTRLRVLNLGGNRLKTVNFPSALPQLRQLFLNNNSFQSLDDIQTTADDSPMPALETLHLDENGLDSLDGGLKRWPSLQVLSLASNGLTSLKSDDFAGLKKLRTLSLQGNRLTRLGDDETGSAGPFVNLDTLTELFLSQNELTSLGERSFEGLSDLRVLTVARNKLEDVDEKAFNGLKRLERLFLNDNNLKYLSNATFDGVQASLQIIDLSDNLWYCDCKLLWLMKWVANQQSIIIDSPRTQCVDRQRDPPVSDALANVVDNWTNLCENRNAGQSENPFGGAWDPDALIPSSNNVWITVLGVVLGVVSIFILLAVSYLYFQDTTKGGGVWRVGDSGGVTSSVFGRWTASGVVLRGEHALRRVPSDMVNLIPKCSNPSSSAASTTGEKM